MEHVPAMAARIATGLVLASWFAASATAGQAAPPKALVGARAAAARACDIEIRAYCTGLSGDGAMACLRKLSHPVGSKCRTAMAEVDRLSAAP